MPSVDRGEDAMYQLRHHRYGVVVAIALATVSALIAAPAFAQSVFQATLDEPNQKTPEANTADVQRALADGSAIVVDSRKHAEYVAGHIAGASNASSVDAMLQVVNGDKSRAIILYCNGQHCQASRNFSGELVAAGFTGVRRYQLGIPMWRALNGPVEIELEGIVRIFGVDRTAVYFDARSGEEFSRGSLPGAHNIPADSTSRPLLGEKAPTLQNDFNTRIIVFGRDGAQARKLADMIGKTPYQNVSHFPGTFEALAAALKTQ
jgi:rhodanese-related sulfurtransferase